MPAKKKEVEKQVGTPKDPPPKIRWAKNGKAFRASDYDVRHA